MTYFHFHQAESQTSIIFKMSKSTKASKEKEMRDYDRERSLVKVREGIEFAADIREVAQTSVFESLDMVDRNPLQMNVFF